MVILVLVGRGSRSFPARATEISKWTTKNSVVLRLTSEIKTPWHSMYTIKPFLLIDGH